jgi:hypothetical protein
MLADMSGLIRQASFFDAAIWFLKDNEPSRHEQLKGPGVQLGDATGDRLQCGRVIRNASPLLSVDNGTVRMVADRQISLALKVRV